MEAKDQDGGHDQALDCLATILTFFDLLQKRPGFMSSPKALIPLFSVCHWPHFCIHIFNLPPMWCIISCYMTRPITARSWAPERKKKEEREGGRKERGRREERKKEIWSYQIYYYWMGDLKQDLRREQTFALEWRFKQFPHIQTILDWKERA